MLAFNRMLAESNDIAGQHETVAEKLTNVVITMLQSSIHEIKQERKKVCFVGFLSFVMQLVTLKHFFVYSLELC